MPAFTVTLKQQQVPAIAVLSYFYILVHIDK
jgi:hypothetical protein